METPPKQQIAELVKDANKILITGRAVPTGDSLGGALACYLFLKNMGKDADIIIENKPHEKYNYLPSIAEADQELAGSSDLVVSVDVSGKKAKQINYKIESDVLKIFITPQNELFVPEDVSVSPAKAKYDLVVVIGTADMNELGAPYEQNREIFAETPIVNIDNQKINSNYGRVNLIDENASSTSEILIALMESIDKDHINKDIAMCLLTGITDNTNSFQNALTTPKSLTVAAQLIAMGADQQTIVRYLV